MYIKEYANAPSLLENKIRSDYLNFIFYVRGLYINLTNRRKMQMTSLERRLPNLRQNK